MKVEFRDSFAKDLKGIRDKSVLRRAKELIAAIEKADSAAHIPNLKKLVLPERVWVATTYSS